MKVLHVSSGNLYGGVETLLATLSRERACCPDMEPRFALCFQDRLSEQLAALGTPAYDLGEVQTRFPWQVWRARRRLARLLREQPADVLVCHMPWALAIFGPVVRRGKFPLVFWMHDVAESKHWIERWAARCPPDLTVCNSYFTADSLRKLFPRSTPRHEVVYCPVPPAIPSHRTRVAMRAEFTTPVDDCVFIQVGRMESYKGATLHLEALAQLAGLPGWTCWIVGGAQRPHEIAYLNRLKAQAKNAGIGGRVRFLGARTDAPELLQAADVFCQPNLRGEPFGIVFIEALYAGLPVIGTALGGVLEIVDDTVGRLVPPGDADLLADTLRTLYYQRELRATLGNAAPERARKLSSPANISAQLLTLLGSLKQPINPNLGNAQSPP